MKALLAGVSLGYVLGRMLAPKSGTELRDDLRRNVRDKVATATAAVVVSSEEAVVHVLNHASKAELMSVKGIGPILANRIIRFRPYEGADKVFKYDVLPAVLLKKIEWTLTGKPDGGEQAA